MLHMVIPDIPRWVRIEMDKIEYWRREVFKKETKLLVKNLSEAPEPTASSPNANTSNGIGNRVAATNRLYPLSSEPVDPRERLLKPKHRNRSLTPMLRSINQQLSQD
uniref:Uncharacterized protein n=1 Tax=Steinernema glaseri TaxID=37863 RepID=A0A1I7ZS70_9BILA